LPSLSDTDDDNGDLHGDASEWEKQQLFGSYDDPDLQETLYSIYRSQRQTGVGPSTTADSPRCSTCSTRFTSTTHRAGRAIVSSDSDEEWVGFSSFLFSFWYLMPKGKKIRGVNSSFFRWFRCFAADLHVLSS
jgi:hypothetical protein